MRLLRICRRRGWLLTSMSFAENLSHEACACYLTFTWIELWFALLCGFKFGKFNVYMWVSISFKFICISIWWLVVWTLPLACLLVWKIFSFCGLFYPHMRSSPWILQFDLALFKVCWVFALLWQVKCLSSNYCFFFLLSIKNNNLSLCWWIKQRYSRKRGIQTLGIQNAGSMYACRSYPYEKRKGLHLCISPQMWEPFLSRRF